MSGVGQTKQFKIEVVKQGALGTLFLGASKLPVRKMEVHMRLHPFDRA